jgi:hypothetical protein
MDGRIRELELDLDDGASDFKWLSPDAEVTAEPTSPGALQIDDDPVTIDGETIDFGVSPAIAPNDALQKHSGTTPDLSPRPAVSSSSWTGRMTPAEQAANVRLFAGPALTGLSDLVTALDAQRFNDDETLGALNSLRELRAVIDDLIQTAERGDSLARCWQAIEQKKGDVVGWIKRGGNVLIAQPVLAYGVAAVISKLCGEPISASLVAAVYGADAVRVGLQARREQ